MVIIPLGYQCWVCRWKNLKIGQYLAKLKARVGFPVFFYSRGRTAMCVYLKIYGQLHIQCKRFRWGQGFIVQLISVVDAAINSPLLSVLRNITPCHSVFPYCLSEHRHFADLQHNSSIFRRSSCESFPSSLPPILLLTVCYPFHTRQMSHPL